jgi:hypothetical protein
MTRPRLTLAVSLALIAPATAHARPDLRTARPAGPLTVYADDARAGLFYYLPGDLAIAKSEEGEPDVRLLHARYTGTAATGDQGKALVRSLLSVTVVMDGPGASALTQARTALRQDAHRTVELRPLPIRRVQTALVYVPLREGTTPEVAVGRTADERTLPGGHAEEGKPAADGDGFWTERTWLVSLDAETAQLLTAALEAGQTALSFGYAFVAEGIPPAAPFERWQGSPALVAALQKRVGTPGPADATPAGTTPAGAQGVVVKAGAASVVVDLARWPKHVAKVDINDRLPPHYAALEVHCYDFDNALRGDLFEKRVDVEAEGVTGAAVRLTLAFTRDRPEIAARSVRFPVAVRLDRPYRFRTVETRLDGQEREGAWQTQESWARLVDVTTPGPGR